MFETPRLIIVGTPLTVIKTRLRCNDFTASIPLSTGHEGDAGVLDIRFPPEWPGDAVALFPSWAEKLESDPEFEMWGGTMIDRADMTAVGQITLSPQPDQQGAAELGYGVNPAYQGRGYATEAARALVRWSLGEPRIKVVTAACLEGNAASVRVLEKVGFRRAGNRLDDEGRMILWEYPRR